MAIDITYDTCLHCGQPIIKGVRPGFVDMTAGRLLCVNCGVYLSERGQCLDCENLKPCDKNCEKCECRFEEVVNNQAASFCARGIQDFNFECKNFLINKDLDLEED